MKQMISLVLSIILCLCLSACGKSEAVKNVETLISSIGEVTIDSKDSISVATSAYDALTTEEQEKVSNADMLSAAKVIYVKNLIDSIGDVSYESEYTILTAEEEYHALSDSEKAQIDNIDTLTQARTVFERLDFVGEWQCISDAFTENFSTSKDGTIKIGNELSQWEVSNDGITVLYASGEIMNFTKSERNDIIYLTTIHNKVFVRSENATITEHQISIDNWQDYFTLEQVSNHKINAFGDLEMLRYPWILSLKDEYRNRIVPVQYGTVAGVDAEVKYVYSTYWANVYEENGEVIIDRNGINTNIYIGIQPTEKKEAYNLANDDYFDYYLQPIYQDGHRPSATQISLVRESAMGYYVEGTNHWNILSSENAEITRIKGSILLYDLDLHSKI